MAFMSKILEMFELMRNIPKGIRFNDWFNQSIYIPCYLVWRWSRACWLCKQLSMEWV